MEKIIYLADKTSDDRIYGGIDSMREKADKSLDEAMREALQFIVCDLSRSGKIINCDTIDAYNEFISN